MLKSKILLFLTLKSIPHLSAHLLRAVKFLWNFKVSCEQLIVWYIEVSSANSATWQATFFGRSLINTRNNTGAMTEPGGTLDVTGRFLDFFPFRMTHWDLFSKKLWIYLSRYSSIVSILESFSIRRE